MIEADTIEDEVVKEEYVLGDSACESYSDPNSTNAGGLRVKAVSEINKNLNKNGKNVNLQGKTTMEAKEIVATSSTGVKRKLVVWMVKKPPGTPNTETANKQLKDANTTIGSSDNVSKKTKLDNVTHTKNTEKDVAIEKNTTIKNTTTTTTTIPTATKNTTTTTTTIPTTTKNMKEVTGNVATKSATIEEVEILSDESRDDDNNDNSGTNVSVEPSLRRSVRYYPQNSSVKVKSKPRQYEKMVELLKKRPDVAQGTAKLDVQNFWDSAALQLNSLGPPVRNASHWKKIWLGLKDHIAKKTAANNTNETKKKVLTDFEESIIALIGTQTSDVDKDKDNDKVKNKEVLPEVSAQSLSDERISVLMQKLITLKKEQYEKTIEMLERQISKAEEVSVSLRRLNRTHEKAYDLKVEKLRELQRHNHKMENYRKKELEIMQRRLEIEAKKCNM